MIRGVIELGQRLKDVTVERDVLKEENESLKRRIADLNPKPDVQPGQFWRVGDDELQVVSLTEADCGKISTRLGLVRDGIVILFFGELWHDETTMQRLLHERAEYLEP